MLREVQMAIPPLFNDSKHFVDLKMKFPPKKVLEAFGEAAGGGFGEGELAAFVEANFHMEHNASFEEWTPSDWKPESVDIASSKLKFLFVHCTLIFFLRRPDFLREVSDSKLREFGRAVHALWLELGKKVDADVLIHDDQYSLMFLPNGVIVPGDRFREYYYW